VTFKAYQEFWVAVLMVGTCVLFVFILVPLVVTLLGPYYDWLERGFK
jgi:hypothetical protein